MSCQFSVYLFLFFSFSFLLLFPFLSFLYEFFVFSPFFISFSFHPTPDPTPNTPTLDSSPHPKVWGAPPERRGEGRTTTKREGGGEPPLNGGGSVNVLEHWFCVSRQGVFFVKNKKHYVFQLQCATCCSSCQKHQKMKRVWDIGCVFHQMVLFVAPTNKNIAIYCCYTQCVVFFSRISVEKRAKKKKHEMKNKRFQFH